MLKDVNPTGTSERNRRAWLFTAAVDRRGSRTSTIGYRRTSKPVAAQAFAHGPTASLLRSQKPQPC